MSWDISRVNQWKSDEFPRGAVIPEAGNSDGYDVGGWRSERPFREEEVCIQCRLCWICCPDSAVVLEGDKVAGFDFKHCKGCGICANECPVNPKFGRKSISMSPEGCELKGVE